ncbi:broad-complex core protein isoforms 1/2/3/4/5-like isoform X2 [Chelonus insularis]|uniref:broad-complex core protein isoforms 1/2/3/4/5-like isoform X2 n=1 Tax=Chelonus insularis TaxID=460826 RepID=UPI00158C4C2F|nr:broad-complex core protein isoforms 1/2/3/4/5-like isoform X2 [Chelonus insularis]
MMGTASDQHYCLRWNNHQVNMLNVFDELLQNEAFTDVAIGVDDGVFVKCHRMILAACSPYFQKLFIEIPCKNPIIILKDVKYHQIKAILEYMYRGEVSIAQDQLATLLDVAECLKIKGLVEDNGSSPSNTSNTHSPRASRRRERRETEESLSPPPSITTSNKNNIAHNSESGNGQPSPPHSTSSTFYGYGKSSSTRAHSESRFTTTPLWSHPYVGQNLAASVAHQAASLSAHHASLLAAAHFDNDLHNRHADSSQGIPLLHPDTQGYRSPSNGSAHDNADARRNSMDVSRVHSPYDSYTTEDNDKKHSPKSFDDNKPRIMNYGSGQKPEWKRYKQYTKDDIKAAIDAVKSGMSALQASRKYRVPSRTLYDKVKKLGITHSRGGGVRRSTNHSGASFPYGIGGNVNGSIYAPITDNDNENRSGLTESPASIIEAVFAKSRENLIDHDTSMDASKRTPSPSQPHPNYDTQQQKEEQPQQQSQIPASEDNDNQVEDLSVNRKSDVRVIVPPIIKEEKIDNPENQNSK